jgi:ABC-type uncharacterized transport system permease subunit
MTGFFEKITNFFRELIKAICTMIPVMAIVALIYFIYGQETATETAWLLIKILGCIFGFDCILALLKFTEDEATDAVQNLGSTRKVFKYISGVVLIAVSAYPQILSSLQSLYELQNNHVVGIIALAVISVGSVVGYIKVTKG